jgi:hypothetical protein
VTVEAGRDRNSRNADWCEEARGKDRQIIEDVVVAKATSIVILFRLKVKGKLHLKGNPCASVH